MAALSDLAVPQVVELRRITSDDLDPVLAEEITTWHRDLGWNFTPSAELVSRFVHMQALSGFALSLGRDVVGYSYYVCEERKGLIGDLYVMDRLRTQEYENLLLSSTVDQLMRTSYIRRIESQLMLLQSPLQRRLPYARSARAYPRNFYEASLRRVASLPPRRIVDAMRFQSWTERHREEAAFVIANSYRGHIDSEINDQYRSLTGARRFLTNITQYPGCGSFFPQASQVALSGDGADSRMVGVCLCSLVGPDAGHVTQVCVSPAAKGRQIGYELMRRAMSAMATLGCRTVSLTVTASNTEAIRLYERLHFRARRSFGAYVWDGYSPIS